jgi:integrase/recombinase XerD
MDNRVTTTIILDTRRQKQDGTYPVKLRVTFRRQAKYFPCNKDLTEENFSDVRNLDNPTNKSNGEKKKSKTREQVKKLKELQTEINAIENEAQEIIGGIKNFSFQQFEKKFLNQHSTGSVAETFADYVAALKDQGRISTANTYECTANALKGFKPKVKFDDITPEFLVKFEQWMTERGNSKTTVGIYMRSLRAIYNAAVDQGNVKIENYPFGRKKYEIPQSRNIKKALTLPDIRSIFQYRCKNAYQEEARDLWCFIYLCNGMNVKDLARLQYADVHTDFIYYERSKTERTKKNQDRIRVALVDQARQIIERWGNKKVNDSTYVFEILPPKISPEKERLINQAMIRFINKHMSDIAENLKLGKVVTTYTARHSFATVLKRSGASTEMISEALGHSDVKTTKNYLDSFENEAIKKAAEALTAF